MSVGVWAGLASSGGLILSPSNDSLWQNSPKSQLSPTLPTHNAVKLCEKKSSHFYPCLLSWCLLLNLFFLLRWPQTNPGDHHRGWERVRLSPYSVERPFICSDHPVHPEMESCESHFRFPWLQIASRNESESYFFAQNWAFILLNSSI